MIAAAFDERITSVVARSPGSPGSSPYRFTSRNTCAEAPRDFPSEWFLPSLRGYTGREHELPIDAHGWYALIAPRRCLIHTAHHDGSEPTFAVCSAGVFLNSPIKSSTFASFQALTSSTFVSASG